MSGTYFILRRDYDALIGTPLLQEAFDRCAHRHWSVGGVEFTGLPEDLIIRITDAIEANVGPLE